MKKDQWYFPSMGGVLGGFWLLGYEPVTLAVAAGLVLLVRPFTPRKYIWVKEGYCIEANVDRAFPRYRSGIMHWKWTDLREVDEPDIHCRSKSPEEGR